MAVRRAFASPALALGLAFAWPGSAPAAAQASTPWSGVEAVRHSQAAIGATVGNHRFVDSRGRSFELEELAGRPYVISMVYTSCHHVCPTLTGNLSRMVTLARELLGEESFNVVTVGFDTANDTPPQMASFARSRGVDTARWRFLSGDPATVAALAEDIGFVYFESAKGFDHLTQTTIVDRDGVVYRQVYGVSLEPPDIVEPLKELVWGRPGGRHVIKDWWDGIRLFCTVYDAAAGRYRFDYSPFVMGGVALVSFIVVGVFIAHDRAHALRRRRRPG